MLNLLIKNKFVTFGVRDFQQTIGISMGTICAPLLDDLFFNFYESDFIQGLLKKKENS